MSIVTKQEGKKLNLLVKREREGNGGRERDREREEGRETERERVCRVCRVTLLLKIFFHISKYFVYLPNKE